jgi:hypothetical protein
VQRFIKRHPVLATVLSFVVGGLPQWVASVWSLVSSDPLGKVLAKKLGEGVTMPSFSPFWITGPIGILMFVIVWYELHRKTIQVPVVSVEKLEDQELHARASKWIANWLSNEKL